MGDEGLAHMELIERWLHGEVVDNTVGIRMRGGPFHGRTRIVELDEQRRPPARQRALGSLKRPPADAWHVYVATPAPDAAAGWAYEYAGTEPCRGVR
ncbi:hypothetical protein ACWD4O_28760 [Streptomyces sp. NPDC002623]